MSLFGVLCAAVSKSVLPVLSRADENGDRRPSLPLRAAAVRGGGALAIIVFCLLAFVLVLSASAAPVSADQAGRAARAWTARGKTLGAKLGSIVERVHAHATTNGTAFYAVKMSDGGTVFLSSDTESAPVVGFTSDGRDFSTLDPKEPLWALLNRDFSIRGDAAKNVVPKVRVAASGTEPELSKEAQLWSDLLEEANPTNASRVLASAIRYQGGVGDLRVAPLVKSQWSQSTAQGKACYNYYTPNGSNPKNFVAGAAGNEVCGCVATAMSQVMRYHCYPKQSVAKVTRTCGWGTAYNQEVAISLTTQGGVYDWANMALSPEYATMSTVNYQAIGKLTSDAGISVYMSYHMVDKNGDDGGSGAYSFDITIALKEVWGYQSAVHFDARSIDQTIGAKKRLQAFQKSLFANFDAGYPVCMGIPGHAIVADGYGFSGTYDYVHLNLGWAGTGDFWYNLPDVTAASSSFTSVDSITYNVFPDKGTDYGILSGRLLGEDGMPIVGGTVDIEGAGVTATTVSLANGVWGIALPDGTYGVNAKSADGKATGSIGGVWVQKPTTTLVNYNSLGRYTPRVTAVENLGNSWGNDITLVKETFEVLEHPAFVPYTYARRSAGGSVAERVGACFTNGDEVCYSLLSERGRDYALGLKGQPVGEWVTGDGTPQLLRAPKLASGVYQVLVREGE